MTDDDVPRYLTVLGLVSEGGQVELFPGFTTESDHRVADERGGPYRVELVGARGTVLSARRVSAQELCAGGVPTGQVALLGKVPVPNGTRTLRIVRGDVVLLERDVPEHPPDVRLTWEPPDAPGDRTTVTWGAEHPDDVPLHFLVVYDPTGDGAWRPVSFVTPERSVDVDLAHLPGGSTCRVAVLASDGFHTVRDTSAPFALPPRPCQAFVLAPLDGDLLPADPPVRFVGQGHWLEEDRIESEALVWTSSRDGELGRGAVVSRSLRPGRHEITLRAGTGDRSSTMMVTIDVGEVGGPNP